MYVYFVKFQGGFWLGENNSAMESWESARPFLSEVEASMYVNRAAGAMLYRAVVAEPELVGGRVTPMYLK